MSSIDIVQLLRSDPKRAMDIYGIITKCPVGERTGGRCRLDAQYLNNEVFEVVARPDPNGSDYYFPWARQGYGTVLVPVNVPPDTLVITHGMSGCRHLMYHVEDYVKFVHDARDYYNGEENETLLNCVQTIPFDPKRPPKPHRMPLWIYEAYDPISRPSNYLTSVVARKSDIGDWDLFESYIAR